MTGVGASGVIKEDLIMGNKTYYESSIKPIKPGDLQEVFRLDPIIEYMNNAIFERHFHREVVAYNNDYYAFIYPYERWSADVLDRAIKEFEDAGWDIFWRDVYDGRGPHTCFYVNRSHFPESEWDNFWQGVHDATSSKPEEDPCDA